jgi:hypothetical protein
MQYKVSKIAEMMCLKAPTIHKWGERGKVLIEGGLIDLEIEPNKTFFTEKGLIAGWQKSEPKKDEGQKSEQGIIEIKPTRETGANSRENVSETQKNNILKRAKTKEELDFLKLRNEKIRGDLIPKDLVGRVTAEVIARYKSTFVQQTDELIRDVCNENGISNEKRTELLTKLTLIANESSKRANQEAKIAIENSVSDSLSAMK